MKSFVCLSGAEVGVISAPASTSKIGVCRLPLSAIRLRFRCEDEDVLNCKVHNKNKRHTLSLSITRRSRSRISASNPNLSGSGGDEEETDGGMKSSDVGNGNGPPLLTILAGFLVFFLILWAVGSLLLWLIGLIFKVPPPK